MLKKIRFLGTNGATTRRLICFSCAGGNGSEYFRWKNLLDDDIEIGVFTLPGRGSRFGERCVTDLSAVVSEVSAQVADFSDKPYAFLGHSLGSLLAFEICHGLQKSAARLPEHLFLSGRKAAHLPLTRRTYYDLPDQQLLAEVTKLGASNNSLLENTEFVELLLPILRADFQLNDSYQYTHTELLPVPITTFCGRQDTAVAADDVARWRELSTAKVRSHLFDGGHFFIEQHAADIARIITAQMNGRDS